MTGIAALALGAGFTSCSHDIEPMTQEEINQIEAQKIVQTYEQAFIKTFGQPAANQNWGFGAANARTRGAFDNTIKKELADQTQNNPTAPAQPTATTFVSKPTTPTFSTTRPTTGVKYAQTNPAEDNGVFYIDNNFTGWDNPQNKDGMTIYADGTNVTYNYQTKTGTDGSGKPGTTIIVTDGSTLNLSGFSNHLAVYLAPNATLNLSDYATFNGDRGMLYLSEKSTVNAADHVTFIAGFKVLNEGGTLNLKSADVDGGAFIYNQTGLVKSTVQLQIFNTGGQFVNNDEFEAVNFNMAANARFLNDTGAKATITGTTYVTNTGDYWQNRGEYTTQTFQIENCRNLFNNCKLTVNGNFNFVKNSAFVIDAENSVKTNSFTWGSDCDFYMGNNSMLLVENEFKSVSSNQGYGMRGTGTGYSVFKAGRINYESALRWRMNYFGNIFVDTDNHFVQGDDAPSNPKLTQPHYYYDESVKFKHHKDACPITSQISSGTCHHGYTPPTTTIITSDADLRIMAEDLSAYDFTDFDFNDVVFDVYYGAANAAKIVVKAAGGTLPLRIKVGPGTSESDYVEVHGLWGEATNIMINTNASYANSKSGLGDKEVPLKYAVNDATDARDKIIIEVEKKNEQGTVQWIPMDAAVGEPAAKFACSPDLRWANERESLLDNTDFKDWVQGAISTWQWNVNIK